MNGEESFNISNHLTTLTEKEKKIELLLQKGVPDLLKLVRYLWIHSIA